MGAAGSRVSEHRNRAHVGNHIVSGDAEGIRHLQSLSTHELGVLFEHASEGGEVHFSDGKHGYAMHRKSDYTFTVARGESHQHAHFTG